MTTSRFLVLPGLLLALVPGPLPACEPESPRPAPRAERRPGRPAASPTHASAPAPEAARPGAGLLAFVDLTTGALVEPPPEAAAQLARDAALLTALSTSHEGLVEERLPDGTVLIDLQGRFQSALVATVGPDGKLRMGHPARPPVRPAGGGAKTGGER